MNRRCFTVCATFSRNIDDYTIEVETVKPETWLTQKLGVVIWGNTFRVMPQHIWEKEDPATFKFSDPVGTGPYKLKSRDPQGNWFLYEKRADWQNSDVGKLAGEPGPKYILFKYFGPEEKRIIAMIQHEMDILQDITPESWDVLRQKNKYAKTWYPQFPYATMDDPCERGMSFNTAKAPYDNPDVRWALALMTDIKNVSMATFVGMSRNRAAKSRRPRTVRRFSGTLIIPRRTTRAGKSSGKTACRCTVCTAGT